MTGKTLTEFRIAFLLDGQMTTTEFPNDNMDRAAVRATQELSKFLPHEKILDVFVGERTVTLEAFTSNFDTAVSLANSPIQGRTDRVNSASDGSGTQFVLGSDYEMNFFNGTITVLSTGDMSDSTEYYITYEKHGIVIDVSAATNIMEVLRLEHPLTEQGYQEIKSFQIWDTKLFIGSSMKESQRKALENRSLWMYYTTQWDAPVAGTGSNYPAHLDELVTKGALGFLYTSLSSAKTIQAASELALANSELDENDAIHTSAASLHTAIEVAADAANLALDAIDHTKFDTAIDAANAALDAVSTAKALERLEDVTAEDALEQIVAAIAALDAVTTEGFTAFDTALAAAAASAGSADTALDGVDVTIAGNALALVGDEITGDTESVEKMEELSAADLLLASGTYLNSDTEPAAKKYLVDGDAKLDLVNVGENVASNFATYAQTANRLAEALIASASVHAQLGANRVGTANAYVSQGAALLQEEQIHINVGTGLVATANAFIAEAESRLSQHRVLLQQAQGYVSAAQSLVEQARSYIAIYSVEIDTALAYLTEAQTHLNEMNAYVAESAGYVSEMHARIAWHGAYMSEIDRHITDARVRLEAGAGYTELSASYLTLAQGHINEFFDGLRERQGMRRQRARASRGQPA